MQGGALTARATSQTFRDRQINGIISSAEASAPGVGPITTKTSPWTTSHRSRKATRSSPIGLSVDVAWMPPAGMP
jgi:hypothetical protein